MEALSRRQACLLMGIAPLLAAGTFGGLLAHPAAATEATEAALASAQEQYAAVQAQIDNLAAQQEALSLDLQATLNAMEAKQAEIDQTQAQIDQTIAEIEAAQAQLEEYQEELAWYVKHSYKNGSTSVLDVILGSSDYEELFRNIYYLTKINNSQVELIDNIRALKQQLQDQQAALEQQRATLEAQYAELDALRAQQEQQLADIHARQDEAYSLLSNLSAEVQALTEQYNQELIEQARAEAEAAAQAAAGGSSGGSSGTAYGSTSASAVVSSCYSTPSPGAGYCAAWVTNVFVNAGIGAFYGNACDMYASWCYSSDRGSLMPGMIVAVSTWSGTSAGRIYGHVGIYIGGGMVMDNIGYIRTIDIDSWVGTYSTTVTPRWGWLGGVSLG